MAQTSDKVSGIAARLMNFSVRELDRLTPDQRVKFVNDVKTLAASALRQDETKGFRRVVNKLLGRG